MSEIWKDISEYENLYQVSNTGKVRSLNYNRKKGKIKELKQVLDKDNYFIVCLSKNKNHKNFKVHRLVAQAYIENPQKKLEVNHIDGNKENNNVSNLEWCTSSENQIHAVNTGLQKIKKGEEHHSTKWISQYDLKGNFIRSFKGLCTASKKLNINAGGITACLKGRNKTAGGFIWKYGKLEVWK